MADELLDLKESAVRDFERHCLATWEKYHVAPGALLEQMTRTHWRAVWRGGGKSRKLEWESYEVGLGVTPEMHLEKIRDAILLAWTPEMIAKALDRAKESALLTALYLWSLEKAGGPDSSDRLARQAQKIENLANYLESIGKDEYADKQRQKAALMRRKAAGENVEIPTRKTGSTTKARLMYAEMERDGKKTRDELIAAAVAAGVHPGTAAVQYARYRKEQR